MTTKTAKAFTKGDKVTMIGNWDDKGTFYIQQAQVYACGHKSMTLVTDNGMYCLGKDFAPIHGRDVAIAPNLRWLAVFDRMTDEDANAKALEIAAEFLPLQRAALESCIARNPTAGAGYHASINKDIAELHEPRVIVRADRYV